MIVTRKLTGDGLRVATLTLTAISTQDHEFLEALDREYLRGGVIEVTLLDGLRVISGLSERRRSPRLLLRTPVLLSWEEEGIVHREHTFTLNVSRFGCALHSHDYLEPNRRVQVQHEGKTLEARVAFSLWDHSNNRVEMGLSFSEDAREFWGATIWTE
jgi:hypothetical protein